MQAEFDQLIHSIVTKINGILADAAGVKTGDITYTDENGNAVTLTGARYADVNSEGYMRGKDGSPIQLFEKITTDGYRKVSGTVSYTDEAGLQLQCIQLIQIAGIHINVCIISPMVASGKKHGLQASYIRVQIR